MNNKSDKKHKPKPKPKSKPKPKPKPKNKKKTMSQPKNKNGGAFSLFGLFSGNNKETSNETELEPLLQSNSPASNASTNPQQYNSTNPPPELPNIQPNAKPQGFNTLKAQSRCSIL